MYQDEVGFEDRPVGGVVEVNIEHPAVAAPVAAKVQNDVLVRRGSGFQCGGQIVFGLRRVGINLSAGGLGQEF
jgi:hypothetical protein